jgi:hypothetical protein
VDDAVGVHDLLNELLGLRLVHSPDLLDPVGVLLLKPLKLLLYFLVELGLLLEGPRELIIFLSELLPVLVVGVLVLLPLGLRGSQGFLIPIFCLLVGLGLLSEHLHVKAKLFFVEAVDRDHVLHALFKNLHFLLEADLLLGLAVSVVGSDVLQLVGVVLFILGSFTEVVVLLLLVQFEELHDLLLVAG